MKGWALTTSIVRDTPYWDLIWPLTEPLFVAYAKMWDLDWQPHIESPGSEAMRLFDQSPAPRGTGVVYAGIPHRRELLDSHEGVIFIDSDAVIQRPRDIRSQVTKHQPISLAPGDNCAVMVMRSGPITRTFLDLVWAGREKYSGYQWCEQAAVMELLGWDGAYPGDYQPARWIGDTVWTRYRRHLDPRFNESPFHAQESPTFIFHPGGVQPLAVRVQLIKDRVAEYSGWTKTPDREMA